MSDAPFNTDGLDDEPTPDLFRMNAADGGTGDDALSSTDDSGASSPTDAADPVDGTIVSDASSGTDFADLATLFSDAGLDNIWIDLDGDLVPDTQISVTAYDPSAPSHGDPFPVDPTADGSDDGSSFDESTFDDGAYADWISIAVDDSSGSSIYDVSDLLPDQSVTYSDWSSSDAFSYDPMQMWNYSVDGGPVIFDPSGGSYCAIDYTDPSLWYNESSFDSGAGYWDPTYAVVPSQPDFSMWQQAPDGYAPNGFDASSDPFASQSMSPADVYADAGYADPSGSGYADTSSSWSVPGYDSSDYSSWDGSSWDSSTYDSSSFDGSSPTDVSSSYYTDYSFDDQLSAASDNYSDWMSEYDAAQDLSWDYWNASTDAWLQGDSSAAYDLNQVSQGYSSYADTSWSNAQSSYDDLSAYSDPSASTYDTSSSYDTSWSGSSTYDSGYDS